MNAPLFELVHAGSQILKNRGLEDAEGSAEWLLAHLLGKSRWELYADEREGISEEKQKQFFDFIEKRSERYPLQYLIGDVPFRGISLNVKPGVLIPRPETEILIDVVLKRLPSPQPSPLGRGEGEGTLNILDIGTGAGCLAISLARELENSKIVATDKSNECIQLAKENAVRNQVGHKIDFRHTDLWDETDKYFDLIVSNPPYLSNEDLKKLQPEVRFEPITALWGGKDGLDFYRRIVPKAREIMSSPGFLVFEVGLSQAESVRQILVQNGFRNIEITKDLAQISRIVSAEFIK